MVYNFLTFSCRKLRLLRGSAPYSYHQIGAHADGLGDTDVYLRGSSATKATAWSLESNDEAEANRNRKRNWSPSPRRPWTLQRRMSAQPRSDDVGILTDAGNATFHLVSQPVLTCCPKSPSDVRWVVTTLPMQSLNSGNSTFEHTHGLHRRSRRIASLRMRLHMGKKSNTR